MPWQVTEKDDGSWDYDVVSSAYGAVVGNAETFEAAIAALFLADADLHDQPMPDIAARAIRDAPMSVARGFLGAQRPGRLPDNIRPKDEAAFIARWWPGTGDAT